MLTINTCPVSAFQISINFTVSYFYFTKINYKSSFYSKYLFVPGKICKVLISLLLKCHTLRYLENAVFLRFTRGGSTYFYFCFA
jgi:hypothetical protein